MKASAYIAEFIAAQGVRHVFGVQGAHILHLVDSIANHPDLEYIACGHEQGAAFAADAYARLKGFGVAVSTSGPGALNLVSGVASAYFDSVPVLFLTGQVTTNTMRPAESKLRQRGFQETDVSGVLKPITKASWVAPQPRCLGLLSDIIGLAKRGRPGAVHMDIPDDVQRADMIESPKPIDPWHGDARYELRRLTDVLAQAKRPVLVLGAGIRQAQIDSPLAEEFANRLGFPVLLTWGGLDLLPYDHPLNCGGFGVCGPYAGNYAIQHADLILCLGTRLDHHMTGNDPLTFAPRARKIILDIDQAELDKYEWPDAMRIKTDLRTEMLPDALPKSAERDTWLTLIKRKQQEHPVGVQELQGQSPYDFIRKLSDAAGEGDIIVTDAGATLCWVMQTWRVKRGQRVLSSFNHSPMGWAIPAAIGAAFAEPGRRIICVTGDGSFQMNVQELAIIAKHNLNIKIFVLNNKGYGIIRQTQDTWLEGRHAGSDKVQLGGPDIRRVAEAYLGYGARRWAKGCAFTYVLSLNGPLLVDVPIDPLAKIVPKTGKGKSISDLEPEVIA